MLLLLWQRRLRHPAAAGQEGRMHVVVEAGGRGPLKDLSGLRGAAVCVRTAELIFEHDGRRPLSPDRRPRRRMPISIPLTLLKLHLGVAVGYRRH